ncbi:UNVERIFIED_ORG: hypothetical protein J2X79_000342 [Arthrobacter globiformis]|nr:hypothetical protein [Arthrobacter globiformis]
MLSLVIVVLVTAAAGFIVWANDRRHTKYGILVPAGTAVSVGVLAWIICIWAGLGYQPGLTWLSWVLPMAAGTVAALAVAVYLGRARARQDTQRLTAALKI